ncbi:hypothetical protein [Streptomyces variegatus]
MSIIVKFFVAPDDMSAGLALKAGPGQAVSAKPLRRPLAGPRPR